MATGEVVRSLSLGVGRDCRLPVRVAVLVAFAVSISVIVLGVVTVLHRLTELQVAFISSARRRSDKCVYHLKQFVALV